MSIAEIDFTKVGKTPVGKVKVAEFKDKWRKQDGSSAILWVKVEGLDSRAFQMWEPKNKALAVGDEIDATVEVKEEEYQGNKQIAVWLLPASGGGGNNRIVPTTVRKNCRQRLLDRMPTTSFVIVESSVVLPQECHTERVSVRRKLLSRPWQRTSLPLWRCKRPCRSYTPPSVPSCASAWVSSSLSSPQDDRQRLGSKNESQSVPDQDGAA